MDQRMHNLRLDEAARGNVGPPPSTDGLDELATELEENDMDEDEATEVRTPGATDDISDSNPPFDLLLGSDLMYHSADLLTLADTIAELTAPGCVRWFHIPVFQNASRFEF